MTGSKAGCSALTVSRQYGLRYDTAWLIRAQHADARSHRRIVKRVDLRTACPGVTMSDTGDIHMPPARAVLLALLLCLVGCKGRVGDSCSEASDCESGHCGDCVCASPAQLNGVGNCILPDGGTTAGSCICEP